MHKIKTSIKRNNKKEILELEKIIRDVKKFTSSGQVNERISKHGNRLFEIIQSEDQKEKNETIIREMKRLF